MASSAVLAIKIIADDQASKTLSKAGDSTSKWGDRTKKAGVVAAGVVGGLVAVGKAAFDSASNLQQQSGAVEAVFGKNAGVVDTFAKKAAAANGLAKSDYSEMAALIGSQLGNMGVSQGKLAGATDDLIDKGSDLSAMFGGSAKDAVGALSSALKGEMDPLEKYGINLSQAKIQAELAARGQDKLTGKAATAAKTQAILSLVQKNSTKATGAFAREADTASGAQARSTAAMENAKATLGTALLPIVATAATKFGELAGWVDKNAVLVQKLAGVLAVIAGVVLIVVGAMKVWNAIQAINNFLMTANPVGLIILAILALIAVVVILYKKNAKFRAILQAIAATGKKVFSAIVGAVQRFGRAAASVVGKVRAFFSRLGTAIRTKIAAAIASVRARVSSIQAKFAAFRAAVAAIFERIRSAIAAKIAAAITSVRNKIQSMREKFAAAKTYLSSKMDAIKTKIQNALEAPFNAVASAVQWVRDKIGGISWPSIPGWLQSIIDAGGGLLGRVFGGGRGAAGPRAAGPVAAPRAFGGGGARSTSSTSSGLGAGGALGGGATFNIYLSGVTDSAGAARAVTRAIDYADKLRGKPVSIRRPAYAR